MAGFMAGLAKKAGSSIKKNQEGKPLGGALNAFRAWKDKKTAKGKLDTPGNFQADAGLKLGSSQRGFSQKMRDAPLFKTGF
jgi:hypothetical protein